MTDMTIVEFLTAQLDYEHRLARESRSTLLIADLDRCKVPGSDEQATFRHHERWEPRRVLAEVAAKRRIIDLYVEWKDDANEYGQLLLVMKHLAQPYADHPDFDPAWAVGGVQDHVTGV